MMQIIDISDKLKWNTIVDYFQNNDIYYKNEYVRSLMTTETGKGVLLYFNNKKASICYPMIIKDIEDDSRFKGNIPSGRFFDMETPYGYGGPLFDNVSHKDLLMFKEELNEWCNEQGIVSQFIRFNPVLNNAEPTKDFFDETMYLHHTIYIDTKNCDLIMKNMDSKNRNMVRKAVKNGVEIVFDDKLESLEEFKSVYTATMDYHNASDMYYFPDEYYDYLKDEFIDHIILLRAVYEGKTISSALFFYDEHHMHYHLSGTLFEYRNLASANLLLYEASCWAANHRIGLLHLGGGLEEDDSLFGFKKQFNKNGYADFWIGKSVFIPNVYEELLDVREKNDSCFDRNNSRMIQYRR